MAHEKKAEGGYGCVYTPAFPCKEVVRPGPAISKMFRTPEALNLEYDLYTRLPFWRIRNKDNFYITEPEKCTVELKNRPAELCKNVPITSDFMVLNYPDGGDTLEKILTDAPSAAIYRSFYNQFNNVVFGLKLLNEKGIYHMDVKPPNIVRLDKQSKFKLIDFGLSKDEPIASPEYGRLWLPRYEALLQKYRDEIRRGIRSPLDKAYLDLRKTKVDRTTAGYYTFWPAELIFVNYPLPHPPEIKAKLIEHIQGHATHMSAELATLGFSVLTNYEQLYDEYIGLDPLEIYKKVDSWSLAINLAFIWSKVGVVPKSEVIREELKRLIGIIFGSSMVLNHRTRLTMSECEVEYKEFLNRAFPHSTAQSRGGPAAAPRAVVPSRVGPPPASATASRVGPAAAPRAIVPSRVGPPPASASRGGPRPVAPPLGAVRPSGPAKHGVNETGYGNPPAKRVKVQHVQAGKVQPVQRATPIESVLVRSKRFNTMFSVLSLAQLQSMAAAQPPNDIKDPLGRKMLREKILILTAHRDAEQLRNLKKTWEGMSLKQLAEAQPKKGVNDYTTKLSTYLAALRWKK